MNEVTDVLSPLLSVIDAVAGVQIIVLEGIENGEDLSVVRNESFADIFTRDDEVLQNL